MKKINSRPHWVFGIVLVLFVSFLLVFGGTALGAGDSLDEAEEIKVPGEFSGELTEENEGDFYKFWIEPGSIIEVEFSSEATDNQMLRLYNPDEEEVFELGSSGGAIETDDYGLANETEGDYWYIGVEKNPIYSD